MCQSNKLRRYLKEHIETFLFMKFIFINWFHLMKGSRLCECRILLSTKLLNLFLNPLCIKEGTFLNFMKITQQTSGLLNKRACQLLITD